MANYSNTAVQTTLSGAIATGDLTLVVADASGYPSAPFRIVLDPGSVANEEVCQVTNKAGTTFTVTRGYDGTTTKSHASGATVIHAVVAADLTDLQAADTSEASARATADALRLLISNYDWSTLPSKPGFGDLALLSTITASLISDASANGRSLITAADYAAMRALLTLVVGVDVRAVHASLAALAGLTLAADKLPYGTGAGSLALADLSAFARTFLDDADAAAALSTLGAESSLAEGRAKTGANGNYTVPGVAITGLNGTTQAIGANQVNYYPILVQSTITLDQLACEVTSAATAGKLLRLGIYNADSDWQPTTLVVDAGTAAADSTGVKTFTINQQLARGRYVLALVSDGAPVMRGYRGYMPFWGLSSALGANAAVVQAYGSLTFGALPSTGAVWATQITAASQFIYCVVTRVSVP